MPKGFSRARAVSTDRFRFVVVLGHRARMRLEADGWAIEFDECGYGRFRTKGPASEALHAAEEHVRRVDAGGESEAGDAPPSSRSWRGASPEFWAAVRRLLQRIADAAVEDARARYELGRLVHRLRRNSTVDVTTSLLARLGQSLGLKPDTLRRYARVSEMIGSQEFEEYMHLRGPHGLPLRWSHIEELSEARSAIERRECAKDAAARALSVRMLRARIRTSTSS
jgi:hypothetical protein